VFTSPGVIAHVHRATDSDDPSGDPIAELLREAYALPRTDPRRERLRHQAIELGMLTARRLAKRFSGRGEPADDLAQVAMMGLIHAVDRYDPREPAGFWPYAAPTIVGELRKHFRDKGWSIRVPRRLQGVWLQIRGEADGLTQRLGRPVTASDLAATLDLDESLIVEARLASRAYAPMSLYAPVLDSSVLADHVAVHEEGYEHVDNEQTVRRALRALPKRVRHIVGLRFRHEMTQAQIAAAVGLSQMHVSRILAEAVATLRDLMSPDDAALVQRGAPDRRAAPGAATPNRSAARRYRTRRSPTMTP
jgi:RNA polymerase sigma-B factor